MSYCRWSSDNWRCDLYCYESVAGGFTTHVAARRIVGDIPPEPSFGLPLDPEWGIKHRAVMDFIKAAERREIGGAYDGETFSDPDPTSFLDRLLLLRDAGYRFPDYVLAEIRDEIREAQS